MVLEGKWRATISRTTVSVAEMTGECGINKVRAELGSFVTQIN